MIIVRIPLGDLSVETARELNQKHQHWAGADPDSYITLADSQNLVLKNIFVEPGEKSRFFGEVYDFLNTKNLAKTGIRNFGDVVACLGSATCAAGITHSPGMAKILTDMFQEKFLSDARYIDAVIHISGCANSCARHHLAALGFSGRADTEFSGNQHAPAYNVYFGGAALPDGKLRLGKKVSEKIYARRVPQLIESTIAWFEEKSNGSETFNTFLARLPLEELNSLVSRFNLKNMPARPEEELEFDWGKDTPNVMQYGEGECS
jgi:sulfite reductase (ferredoxin)